VPPPPPKGFHGSFGVGTVCEAKYSADGVFYKARIDEIQDGNFLVAYVEFGGQQEWLPLSDLKMI